LESKPAAATLTSAPHSDEKVANRDTKVWHGATENGPLMMTNPKPFGIIVDRAASNFSQRGWIRPSFNSHSLKRNSQTFYRDSQLLHR
jgi:hypothetical protein